MENYGKQQNLGINNNNINKSDFAAKGLYLKGQGSSKVKKNVTEYIYWTFVIGSSIPNEIRQKNVTMVKTLRENNDVTQIVFHEDTLTSTQ